MVTLKSTHDSNTARFDLRSFALRSFALRSFALRSFARRSEQVGPYSLLLPDDDDDPTTGPSKVTKIRYVNSPATKYLQRPLDYTLTTSTSDFPRLFGELAVNNTIAKQTGDVTDPFEENKNTCANGDAKPILPLVDFRIDENDDIQIDFNFHLFVYPASDR